MALLGASLAAGCSVTTSLDGLAGGAAPGETENHGGAGGLDAGSQGATLADVTTPVATDDGGGGGASGDDGGDAGPVIDSGGGSADASDDTADSAVDPCAACPTSCGTSIDQPFSSLPSDWIFNGSARWNSSAPSGELTTPVGQFQAGTLVYANPIAFDQLIVEFQFRIGLQGGTRGDGMAFMIETSGPNAVGNSGGGLGLAGLSGFAAELDVYDNGVCGDSSDDHVGVDLLDICDPVNQTPTSLFATDITSTLDLGDTHWHTAQVLVSAGTMSLAIDNATLVSAVSLPGFQSTTPYYLGFAAATGGLVLPDGGVGGYRQEVKNVTITFPTPRCL
jgi:hypothetical protein